MNKKFKIKTHNQYWVGGIPVQKQLEPDQQDTQKHCMLNIQDTKNYNNEEQQRQEKSMIEQPLEELDKSKKKVDTMVHMGNKLQSNVLWLNQQNCTHVDVKMSLLLIMFQILMTVIFG